VFKLTPSEAGYSETILHSFTGGSDGATPKAGLSLDGKGNLYGTASGGGTHYGTVFEVTP
ncbi:MAG: choice-of-anchor tandem repeat GloVer-containing protein, partial [Candidatus Cybelea sp.]